MESIEGNFPRIIACPLTIREVCSLLDTYVDQFNEHGLRIWIRGTFRDVWTKERIFLKDWHFLKSWSAFFKVMGLFPLPFDEDHHPWPEVLYYLYEGPGELQLVKRGLASGALCL